jgi:hypothetical protein
LKVTRNIAYQGVVIEYSHLSSRLYFGFESRDGFNLALPEKALLDTLYYRRRAPFVGEMEFDGIDADLLREMSKSHPLRVREMIPKLEVRS